LLGMYGFGGAGLSLNNKNLIDTLAIRNVRNLLPTHDRDHF
jgi:hypothetical protein